jgi:hypothetical protein
MAQKYDSSKVGKPGRPSTASDRRELILRMARESRSWGYTPIQGALRNRGHEVGRGTVGKILRTVARNPPLSAGTGQPGKNSCARDQQAQQRERAWQTRTNADDGAIPSDYATASSPSGIGRAWFDAQLPHIQPMPACGNWPMTRGMPVRGSNQQVSTKSP